MNISLAAEPLFHLGSLPVTNTSLMSLAILALVLGVCWYLRGRIVEQPRGLVNALEAFFEAALDFMTGVTQDREQSKKFFPLVMTIFLVVLLSNWIEVLPGLGTIGIWGEHGGQRVIIPFLRSSSADLNFTLAIAIASVLGTQILGIIALGFFRYAGKFLNFHGVIEFFVGLLELVSELAKLVSFSFRLFGNIFAGEVLLIVVSTLVPYLVPLPFVFLEFFVGIVQALVFSMLTLVFLKGAATAHDGHDEHSVQRVPAAVPVETSH